MHRMILLSCLAALAAPALPAWAAQGSDLRQVALSADLYARGLAEGDAVMILTAARLRKGADLKPGEGAGDLALSWQAMLAQAELLAADDPALLAIVDDIRADEAKGAAAGPVYSIAVLPAASEIEAAELAFSGGEYAEVYVESAPGTDVNLTIRDAAGNLICADTHASHVAYCAWTPATDGIFLLTVENRSTAPADYALMTN